MLHVHTSPFFAWSAPTYNYFARVNGEGLGSEAKRSSIIDPHTLEVLLWVDILVIEISDIRVSKKQPMAAVNALPHSHEYPSLYPGE